MHSKQIARKDSTKKRLHCSLFHFSSHRGLISKIKENQKESSDKENQTKHKQFKYFQLKLYSTIFKKMNYCTSH